MRLYYRVEVPLNGQDARGSGSCAVEVLQEVVGGELDLLVSPLRGPVLASEQARPMDTTEVPIDEAVPGLGVTAGTVREPRCHSA